MGQGNGIPRQRISVSRAVGFWSNILIYVARVTEAGKVEDRRLLLKETTDFFVCERKVPLKFYST